MMACTRLKADEDHKMYSAANEWLQEYIKLSDEPGQTKTISTVLRNSFKRLPYAMRLMIEQYKIGKNADNIEKTIQESATRAKAISDRCQESDMYFIRESYDTMKMDITIDTNEMVPPLSAATGLEKKWFKLEENTELLDRLPAIMKSGIKNQDLAIDNMI